MADDLHQKGPQDRSRISLTEEWDVAHWAKDLGVSKEMLRQLVADHGDSAKRIREGLGK